MRVWVAPLSPPVLLESWSLRNYVAGSKEIGGDWRTRYLEMTYQAGACRAYEGIIAEAAQAVGLATGRAHEVIRRWGELAPWSELPAVVRSLLEKVPVAVATCCSIALARVAVSALGVSIPTVVTAEEAGYYNSRPNPYRMALQRLRCAPGAAP